MMSPPPLCEDPDAEISRKLRDDNAAVNRTAACTRVDYVPVTERFTGHLARQDGRCCCAFGFAAAFLAATGHDLFGRRGDEFARGSGLGLYAGRIHLSDRGGALSSPAWPPSGSH